MIRPRAAIATALVILVLAQTGARLGQAQVQSNSQKSAFLIQTWSVDDGLPQSSVISIAQTPDGYLWFGTFDGLVRFDGVRFSVFDSSTTPGMAAGGIIKLYADRSGRLWIGTTEGGLSMLEKGVFRKLGPSDGLPPGGGSSFIETGQGSLLLASGNLAMRKFDGARFVETAEAAPIARIKAANFEHDRSGVLYASLPAGLAWLEGMEWRTVSFPRPPPGLAPVPTNAFALTPASAGGLWVTVNGQILRLEKGAWAENLGIIPWPPAIRPFTTLEDSSGLLWIGSYGAGLYHRRGMAWARISAEEGLPNGVIRALLEDREGSIWVGTDGGGLARLKPKLFTNYTIKDGLPENIVTSLCGVDQGSLWIGTHGGGLTVMRGSEFKKIDFPPRTNNRWIWSLYLDSSSTLWGGTFGPRLFYFRDGKYGEMEIPDAPEKRSINAIVTDRHGVLWAGTRGGLLCYSNGIPRTFTARDGLADNHVHALLEASDGVLWIGTEEGLTSLSRGSFTRVARDQLKKVYGLFALGADLWVGMKKAGLARIRDGRVSVFRKADGLPHDHVESIVADGMGNLWASGHHGIFRVALAELEAFSEGRKKTIDAFLYGRDDGLGSRECPGGHQQNVLQSSDGRLWFGTVGGLSVIDPHQVKPNILPPQVWIEDIFTDAKEQRSAIQSASTNEVILPAGTKQLEIHYTALSFLAPGQVLFKYRLHGFDQDWIPVGNRRVAYYQGLPPGPYHFQVIACNNNGVWNKTGAALAVVMQPFFWQTSWFRGAAVMLVVASGFLVYHRRVSMLQREQRAQREFSARLIASQEQERKRVAGEIHDSLGQNLIVIKNRADVALSGDDVVPLSDQLAEISRSASEAIQEVRTIAHNLRPYQLDRLGLTKALEALVKQIKSSGLALHAEIESIDRLFEPAHEINLYRIAQESLNNILKHSGAKTAWVTVKKEKARVTISVRDDGRGFDYSALLNDPKSKRGLGLTGLIERARSMGGDLQIDSAPGQGTQLTFTIRFPLSPGP